MAGAYEEKFRVKASHVSVLDSGSRALAGSLLP